MQNTSFLKIVLIYVTIIVGILLWSGNDKEKSLYDKYLITFKGVEFEVNDLDLTKSFIADILEMDIEDKDQSIRVNFPERKYVIFNKASLKEIPVSSKPLLKVHVKNGLTGLHNKLTEKLLKQEKYKDKFSINEIKSFDNRSEFRVESPEIIFVYYHKNFFSK